MAHRTIADVVDVARVETVVKLDGRPGRLGELVLTGDVAHALEVVLGALDEGGAFFLVGHFGSGKSHLLAALAELCAGEAGEEATGGAVEAATGGAGEAATSVTVEAATGASAGAATSGAGEAATGGAVEAATGGWDPALRDAAASARPRLVAAVPLVEHRAGAQLEDLVLARAWSGLGLPAPAPGTDRRAAWDALAAAAAAAGRRGVVVLLDELSEFLRAKKGPALTEDLRFLQFVGEWAAGRPVAVVAALQESIEEIANVSQRELARIRDRYRSLSLSMRHVEDLVRGRLVRVRPGAEAAVADTHRALDAAFPGWGVPAERFARCYPVHPATLALLEGLRFLFSQQRGVVDFICRQMLGDPAAQIPAWQDRDRADLLPPDRVYDHFRDRLHERVETRRLAETVVPYYERAVDDLFDDHADRELALRVVKLLCLLAASPLERPRSAAELAHMLLARVSALDAQANVAYLEHAILGPLAGSGAYVVARPDPAGAQVYDVELEADAAEVAAARLAQARAELTPGDRRVVRTLYELGSTPVLPLALFDEVGPARRDFLWQNTQRSLVVALTRLGELGPADVTAQVEQARALGAEGCLLVAEPELEDGAPGRLADHARALVAAAGRLAVWAPAPPTPDEVEAALELHSRRLVLEQARAEGRTEPGGLVEFLDRDAEGDRARARELLARVYFGGALVAGGGSGTGGSGTGGSGTGGGGTGGGADLPTLAGLPFERQLPALADPLLSRLHPRHQEVAPQGQLVGERILRQLVTEVLVQPRITSAAADRGRLRPLLTGYLVPLGLVRRRSDAVVLAPDPTRSPAVAEALRLVPDGGSVPTAEVVRRLADGEVGLTEPEALLVLNALVQAGLLEAWRGRRRVTDPFLAVAPTEELRVGELLEPAARAALTAFGALAGPGPFEPWNAALQRGVWERLCAWLEARRDDVAAVRSGFEALAETPELADVRTEGVAGDLARVGAVADACDPEAAPAPGLRQLVAAAGDVEELLAAARRLAGVARFLREGLAQTVQSVAYLASSQLRLPEGADRLAALRDEVLTLGRDVLRLAAEDRVGELVAANRQFRDTYLETYRQAHEAFYRTPAAAEVEAVRATPAYGALAALAEMGAVAVPDDRVKVDRALQAAVPAPCTRRLDVELQWRPRCSCGFGLGDEPPAVDAAALQALAERGVREHLDELGRAEHRQRLEQAAEDLAALGRDETAADLRSLLGLVARPERADATALAHLVAEPLASVVRDVLAGGRLVVRRDLAALREDLIGRRYPKRRLLELVAAWVDPDDDLPAGGFIEVVDSAEDSPGGARGSRPGSWAPGGEAAWGGGEAASGGDAASGGGAGAGGGEAASGEAAGGGGEAASGGDAASGGEAAGGGGEAARVVASSGSTYRPGARPGARSGDAVGRFLADRFPRLAALLPSDRPGEAFWLAAWWAGRPGPPAWLPAELMASPDLAPAAAAAADDPAARAALADLDARVGADSLLGDQVAAALDVAERPTGDLAADLARERLLRHPVRLGAAELVRRVANDWGVAERAGDLDLARLAAGHALLAEAELAPLGHVLAAGRHLAEIDRGLPGASCPDLVEHLYPAHGAAVPELLSRAELATAGSTVLTGEAVRAVRVSAARVLAAADAAFGAHAAGGFPGCLPLWEVGRAVVEPLLGDHDRIAVLLVDAMRADVWQHVRAGLAAALPGRAMRLRWAVVGEPTRTVEALAGLYSGRPVPAGAGPATPAELGTPFAHLGVEAESLVGVDGAVPPEAVHELWSKGPRLAVAVATGVDARVHGASVEVAELIDEAAAGLARRVLPTLAWLPAAVPLVVLADHGFRENAAWGRGPDGRYAHGGLSLEESIVPVAVYGAAQA